MNRKILFWPLAAVLLTACEKGLVEDVADVGPTGQVTNSVLQITTRSAAPDEATVAYPVQVYVFAGDECRAVQTIGDAGQTLNIALVEGTYSVYAIGGASTADYVLPSASEATVSSALTLKDGRNHGDLMAATATATLVDGGTNTVTLGMARKTMLIQSVVIKKVPTAATAVSVTIAPLWEALCVGGSFSTVGSSETLALSCQEDGRTWTLDGEDGKHLLPPSSQPASVSVNITIGGATKTYTYSCSDQLEAGYKINIDGTYTEAVGVNLTGTITGATWLGERTIRFEFDENGTYESSGNDEPSDLSEPSSDIPAVGDTYHGCYVLAVSDADDYADVTLLSPTEFSDIYDENGGTMQANIDAALGNVNIDGISGWEVPTSAEAELMYNARGSIGNLTASNYLCNSNGYRAFKPTDDEFNPIPGNVKGSTVLRPVATITINKE
jgi:hypothetical protein